MPWSQKKDVLFLLSQEVPSCSFNEIKVSSFRSYLNGEMSSCQDENCPFSAFKTDDLRMSLKCLLRSDIRTCLQYIPNGRRSILTPRWRTSPFHSFFKWLFDAGSRSRKSFLSSQFIRRHYVIELPFANLASGRWAVYFVSSVVMSPYY